MSQWWLEFGVSPEILPLQANSSRTLSRSGKFMLLGIVIIFWVTLFFFFFLLLIWTFWNKGPVKNSTGFSASIAVKMECSALRKTKPWKHNQKNPPEQYLMQWSNSRWLHWVSSCLCCEGPPPTFLFLTFLRLNFLFHVCLGILSWPT